MARRSSAQATALLLPDLLMQLELHSPLLLLEMAKWEAPSGRDRLARLAAGCYLVHMADDPQAELERLRAENQRLKQAAARGGSIRVSEKGGLSVYGLGRFPVTLYYEQWIRLLDTAPELRKFLESAKSDGKLKLKEK